MQVCTPAVLTPLVSDALLARLRETFPADVVGLSRLSHEAIRERIGEQRVIEVLQAWHNEQIQHSMLDGPDIQAFVGRV